MGRLDAHNRMCVFPGCGKPKWSDWHATLFCRAHSNQRKLESAKRYRESISGAVPRSVNDIKADLAAQLAAVLRRFEAIVEHDRNTEPLEDR